MHKVLIVDDEELICRGLMSMIERCGLKEIEEICFTADPKTVSGMVKELQPDIIITDICMPDITGLDLIRDINGVNPLIKFIVLSGYDDFKYVKEAFKLGVEDYLLKPGSKDELMAILEKVIDSIKEDEKRRLSQADSTFKYMEAVLENKLNKIFTSWQDQKNNIGKLFEESNIIFPYSHYCVGIVAFDNNNSENKSNEKVKYCLDRVSAEMLNEDESAVYYFYDYNSNLVLLYNFNDKLKDVQLIKYLKVLMKMLKDNINVECLAAISKIASDIKSIISCHNEAAEALSYRLIYEPYEVITYDYISSRLNGEDRFAEQLLKLKECMLSYNTVEISNLIDALFSRDIIKNINIKSTRRLYENIINKVSDIVNDNGLNPITDKYQEFGSFKHLSDLKIYLKTLIFETLALLKDKTMEVSVSDIVKKYVQENFYKDIDMAVAANLVSMSYSHFSKIFKDETGMNFSDYLIKVRMENALEMLSNPVNKIQDVAQSIGYSNPKHFTRAFKNYFGFPPTEYRYNG